MFSQLSKGYGSWTAGYVDPYFGEKKAHDHHEFSFPEIDHESHIHGITVGSRSGRSTAMSWATAKRSREPTLDGIPLPKTYTTRKGALQLYVGPDDLEDDDEDDDNDVKEDGYALKPKYVEIKRPNGQELIDLSLKLGTMERLAMSVLQFGDQDYDHEHTSVSDAKNKAFLKFLHKVDEGFETTGIDSNVQPGGDLNNYLRDLKSSASNHSGNMRVSKSRESLELQAILRGLDNNTNWPMSYSQDGGSDRQSVGQFTRPVSRVSSRGPSPGYRYCLLRKRYFLVRPPSTPRSTYQVLSAKKLCASIKSGSYLGRPSSRVSVNDDEILEGDARGHITSASITRPVWTPAESMDDFLTESRDGFYRGEEDTDSDGGKLDEENTSDVRSNRSGRKSRSKRSKSGLGSGIGSGIGSEENDDTVSAIEFALPSGTDYTLPSLDSDRLLAKTDGSNKEVQQTINDEQTGFSGSTGSYSDILASNSNSRPATATQSRPASSLKLSRPTSASARPLSATEHERDQDKTVVGGNQDVSKDAEIAVSNKDDNDVALKTGSIQNESETTKTGERNLEKTDTVKQPDKLANNDYLRKPPDIGRNDKDKTFAVEGKDKDDMSKKNHKSGELDAPKLNLKKQSDEKRPQPVPKTGKSNNERKTVGKHITPGRGVPPKLPKPDHKSKQKENEKQKDDNVDVSSKETLDKTVVEGEGLLETVSEHVSKLDKVSGDGNMEADVDVSAVMDGHDITDSIAGSTDAHSIAAELDALGLRKKSKGDLTYPLLPPGKRPKAPAEKAKIPDHIAEALNRQTDASMEYLEQDLERRGFLKDGKVTALVGESLSGPTLEAVGEGLTEEELELAKQILQQKLDEAKGKLDGKPVTKGKAKKPAGKLPKKGAKKPGKGKQVVEEKSPEELDREAIREKHEQEKKNLEYLKIREQEAAELQKKIAEKQRMLKEQNDLTSARSKELQEEMERLEREAEAIQRAEDEAREILADVRKKQREEREARRKADLERKKQEALERREREKKEMEDKRRKEMEMMEKIADAEMRRRMREEEERRIYEEERLAQERYEEELREAQRLEEEEEERLKEMERQAEEEAMQRLIEEREAAERERRRLREEEEALRDAENLRRLAMEVEQSKLEEERRKMQEAEEAKREAERQRLLELRQLEQEARIKMQEEIEKRRTDALARRDYNLENRLHVDKLRHGQGLTRAWTFSYFVHWPRETYESQARRRLTRRDRPIGAGDPRKVVKINNPKPKKADPLPESGEAPQAAVP
ncbi:calponin homology domain-containing protein DDB_G0272472-like isoform X8 [Mercenaria mercenaria]|uniref:calponin homology domain-containing protein DDB_G0272472-like isoform X8 n=1 Tax=Mercenaria mercenaria TaxID=6596 RepID=UPI00234F150F|nr:calponin homology domain-containing protein DDB_G0272472-like isoform X8 [Mercenaria mercenaria]